MAVTRELVDAVKFLKSKQFQYERAKDSYDMTIEWLYEEYDYRDIAEALKTLNKEEVVL